MPDATQAAPPEQNAGGDSILPAPLPLSSSAPAPSASGLDDVQPGLPRNQARSSINDISQFGQPGLTYDEALAACGPAAAVRLASVFGNNIPLKAALDAAKQVGWTSGGGMNGISNEKRLLDKLGIPAVLDTAPDMARMIADASSGNPVTISTPNHYFTLMDYDASSGKFKVGASGTVYKAGGEWLSYDQIRRIGGGVNGALFVDAPTSPTPGVAVLENGTTEQRQSYTQPQASQPGGFDGMVRQAQDAVQAAVGDVGQAASDAGAAVQSAVQSAPQVASQAFDDIVGQARQAVGYIPEQAAQAATGLLTDVGQTMNQGQTAQTAGTVEAANQAGAAIQDAAANPVPPQPADFARITPLGAIPSAALNQVASTLAPFVAGPELKSDEQVLSEASPLALDVARQYAALGGSRGDPSALANALRSSDLGVAYAGTHTGAGGGAPEDLPGLLSQIGKYTPDVQQGLQDFVKTQSQAGRSAQEIGDTVRQWISENPPPIRHTVGPVDTEPGGLIRSIAADESSGAAGPQRGQLSLGLDNEPANIPYGGPRPTGTEQLPGGPQRGQLDLTGNPLPYGGPRPTGTEELAAGARPGQARFPEDASLYGETVRAPMNIAPIQAREIPMGVQPGQRALPEVAERTGSRSEKAMAVRYGSMLSSWYTHTQNIVSNAGQMFARPTRLAAGGYPGEAGAAVRGYMQGIPDGVAAFWDTFKNGARDATKLEQGTAHPFGTGKVGRVVDLPSSILQATDDFFKSVVYSGTIRSEATRLAKGNSDTLAELLKSPTSNMVREAEQQARLATYTEDPGRIVNKILNVQRGLDPAERLAINFVIPFVRTPSNILRRGVQFTAQPVTGPVKIVRALKRGDSRTARLEAADTALASIVALGFAAKAAAGELSGDGPTNASERQQLIDQGWQPHSIKVGDQWVDYSWAGPLGIQMALIANTYEAVQNGKQGAPTAEQVVDIANRLKGVLLQQSFLRGIGDLFKNTQSGFAGNVASYLGSAVPFGGLVKDVAEATDPLARQADPGVAGVPDRLAERVPVLRETVRPDQTSLGDAAPNPRAGGGVLRGSQVHPDSTLSVLQQADVTVPAPPKSITYLGATIPLTPEEQDLFNTTRGQAIRRAVEGVTARADFKKLGRAEQSKVLQATVSAQSDSTRDWMLRRLGKTEIARRQQGAVAAR